MPVAQLLQLCTRVGVVCVYSLLPLVVCFLPRKMATSRYNVIAGATAEEG